MSTVRLVNPDENALNEAFAIHVAGYQHDASYPGYWIPPGRKQRLVIYYAIPPPYLSSVDAILPYLEATGYYASIRFYARNEDPGYMVSLWENDENGSQVGSYVNDASVARALVIALLRAHGVEITFT